MLCSLEDLSVRPWRDVTPEEFEIDLDSVVYDIDEGQRKLFFLDIFGNLALANMSIC